MSRGPYPTPRVYEHMTRIPRTINGELPVSKAGTIMRGEGIRHLPVLHEGKLVGIISDRDIRVAECIRGPAELLVEDVMTPDPYVVRSDAFIDDVVDEMIKRKYGSAVVQAPDGQIIGILTTVDALQVLEEIMHLYYAHSGP